MVGSGLEDSPVTYEAASLIIKQVCWALSIFRNVSNLMYLIGMKCHTWALHYSIMVIIVFPTQARAAGIPLVIDGNAVNVCANQTDIVSG